MRIPAERFVVSLPALRAGSRHRGFSRLGAGELADRLASHRGLQQLAQPVVEALSRQSQTCSRW